MAACGALATGSVSRMAKAANSGMTDSAATMASMVSSRMMIGQQAKRAAQNDAERDGPP